MLQDWSLENAYEKTQYETPNYRCTIALRNPLAHSMLRNAAGYYR
jgi:hypothetical protein